MFALIGILNIFNKKKYEKEYIDSLVKKCKFKYISSDDYSNFITRLETNSLIANCFFFMFLQNRKIDDKNKEFLNGTRIYLVLLTTTDSVTDEQKKLIV